MAYIRPLGRVDLFQGIFSGEHTTNESGIFFLFWPQHSIDERNSFYFDGQQRKQSIGFSRSFEAFCDTDWLAGRLRLAMRNWMVFA
jgi:hypothetical protein